MEERESYVLNSKLFYYRAIYIDDSKPENTDTYIDKAQGGQQSSEKPEGNGQYLKKPLVFM